MTRGVNVLSFGTGMGSVQPSSDPEESSLDENAWKGGVESNQIYLMNDINYCFEAERRADLKFSLRRYGARGAEASSEGFERSGASEAREDSSAICSWRRRCRSRRCLSERIL